MTELEGERKREQKNPIERDEKRIRKRKLEAKRWHGGREEGKWETNAKKGIRKWDKERQ